MTKPNMESRATLEAWLGEAARGLSAASAAQVTREIEEHYESAREAALSSGANASDAEQLALSALGRAKTVNCQYRKVLLTSSEARMLRNGNCEARVVCSRPWLKRLLLAAPVAALLAATGFALADAVAPARMLLAGALGMGVFFAAPFLPLRAS